MRGTPAASGAGGVDGWSSNRRQQPIVSPQIVHVVPVGISTRRWRTRRLGRRTPNGRLEPSNSEGISSVLSIATSERFDLDCSFAAG